MPITVSPEATTLIIKVTIMEMNIVNQEATREIIEDPITMEITINPEGIIKDIDYRKITTKDMETNTVSREATKIEEWTDGMLEDGREMITLVVIVGMAAPRIVSTVILQAIGS